VKAGKRFADRNFVERKALPTDATLVHRENIARFFGNFTKETSDLKNDI
jgi:hypothetical protein